MQKRLFLPQQLFVYPYPKNKFMEELSVENVTKQLRMPSKAILRY
jgi:hypothetical protein